ncbi:MAG: type II secretion system protein [Dechloromonas sp.]|nr:type II secretion system protein [Dechloromonas sp.]
MVNRITEKRKRGFTLIELLVVLSIVALLSTIAAPRYFQSLELSKEAILANNLKMTRETIDRFYGDQGRYPNSLDELIERQYLRNLPYDTIVESSANWIIIPPRNNAEGQVFDIRSSATGLASDGKAFQDM